MSVIFLSPVTQLDEEVRVEGGRARKSYMGSWERSTRLKRAYFGSKGTPYPLLHELPPRRRGTPTLIKLGFKFMAHL